jgi:hypothetical protein
VAEETKKPVLMLPSGELGEGIYSLQTKLRKIVQYATSWKAVLLIDEADVFLEKRETGPRSNLERNALVAGMSPFPQELARTFELHLHIY